MGTIEDIRRTNLASLRDEAGGLRRFAERVGVSEAQMSQWINGSADSKTGKARGMRKESARRIETAMGRDPGWLDVPHGSELAAQDRQAPAASLGSVIAGLGKQLQALAPSRRRLIATYAAEVLERGPTDESAQMLDDLAQGLPGVLPQTGPSELDEFIALAKDIALDAHERQTGLSPADFILQLSEHRMELLEAHRARLVGLLKTKVTP